MLAAENNSLNSGRETAVAGGNSAIARQSMMAELRTLQAHVEAYGIMKSRRNKIMLGICRENRPRNRSIISIRNLS